MYKNEKRTMKKNKTSTDAKIQMLIRYSQIQQTLDAARSQEELQSISECHRF